MTNVFVIPFEIKDNNTAVFKIIEGKEKDQFVSIELNDIDFHFVTELFKEAEADIEIDTPVLKLDPVNRTIVNEVV
ncbi:hypothetical protein [Alkalibacterium sp. 20]|uniref:hypothetical protein n=1 Tax=Alkalibacterium sp. 20 TaxID=1798803 RepID=UPI00090037E5|nr:hypothetical protein [Alkalibacterium sp. 20]OJF96174.1 hypothetical protein AX762_05425 [Alkalibacterium sp. 20]